MSEEVIIARETKNVSGTVQIGGAKNSALKLIAASILGQGKSVLHNVPHISDTHRILYQIPATYLSCTGSHGLL